MREPRPVDWALYLPLAHALRDAGLCCLGAGEHSGRRPALPRRVLSHHALVVISAGSGTFRDARGERTVEAPAWMWLVPGEWHSYETGADGWTEHWVLFEGVGTRTYRSFSGMGDGNLVLRGALPSRELDEIFAGLHRSCREAGRRAQLHASSLVHRLFGALGEGAEERSDDQPVVRYLVETASEDLSVTERAAHCGLTVAEFRKQVRRTTGLTPHEVVLATRLSRAQGLLARSDLQIGQIAVEVGYDDPSYFTRIFTRRVGVSPRTFRQEQRRPEDLTPR